MTGRTVTLKLKTPDFQNRTRSATLEEPTQLAHVIFEVGRRLLKRETGKLSFRLIGIGISHLAQSQGSELQELDVKRLSLSKAEVAMDKIRAKFGSAAVDKGIGLKREKS